jgi:formylglycine-generating enzyme required for sulfatase activity
MRPPACGQAIAQFPMVCFGQPIQRPGIQQKPTFWGAMKIRILTLFILILAAFALPAVPQDTGKPLGKDQVLDLVKFGMDGAELAKRIKASGIDFEPTDDYLETLRKAGAQDLVIHALREARPRPLTRDQVGGLVAGGVSSQRAVMLVRQNGIDFVADERYLQTLRLAGGDETLIASLRKASAGGRIVHLNPKDGLKYVWIAPGTFKMGCSPGDNACSDSEKPAHEVTLTKGFWLGQTEVTVGAYKRYVTASGQTMPPPAWDSTGADEAMPVVSVSWDEATAFCDWTGGRLPTEAEWEYASRAGTAEARYGHIDEIAWHVLNSDGKAHDVAQKAPNAWNLYDTLGNVWEWVSDWYDENYYRNSPSQDPAGPANGEKRVVRSGSWFQNLSELRESFRGLGVPSKGSGNVGFRCGGDVFAH